MIDPRNLIFASFITFPSSASSNGSVEHHFYKNENKHQEPDVFKAPYSKSGNQQQPRQRKNSQSSYNSRENSMERGFINYSSSRDNSLDRRRRPNRFSNSHNSNNGNRDRRRSDYSSSRENSAERYGNWNRGNDNMNSWRSADPSNVQKIAELTKQFEHSVDLNKGGVLLLPHQQQQNETEKKENSRQDELKTLFDPRNPSRPILVTPSSTRPRDIEAHDDLTHSNYLDQQQHESSNARPTWYDRSSEAYNSVHKRYLIDNLEQYDCDLQMLVDSGELFEVSFHLPRNFHNN